MKQLLLCLLPLFIVAGSTAQQQGSIVPAVSRPKAGVPVEYIYTPPAGLLLPQKTRASVLYYDQPETIWKKIVLEQTGNQYRFTFRAPDSCSVLAIAITDFYNKAVDNNHNKGYLVYLQDANGNRFRSTAITEARIFSDRIPYEMFRLKRPDTLLLKQYEKALRSNPDFKQTDFYSSYLATLNKVNPGTAKQLSVSFVKQLLLSRDEKKWIAAGNLFNALNMQEQANGVRLKCVTNFPDGAMAKMNFMYEVATGPDTTDNALLNAIDVLRQRFRDSSAGTIANLCMNRIYASRAHNDLAGIIKYSELIPDKNIAARIYNDFAWDFAGDGLEGPPVDINIARTLIERSLYWVNQSISEGIAPYDPDALDGAKLYHTESYAAILYKQKNYDSAYYYQQSVMYLYPEKGEGNERLAIYAEKAKGAAFARDLVEPQMLKGVNSPAMLEQLRLIYSQLNLPEADFLKIKETNALLVGKNRKAALLKIYGTEKAPGFKLSDQTGKQVSLSSLRGKVVVLDFWATWCMPCKASLPAMQQLVNQYKNNPQVVFLFIDCFENKDAPAAMLLANKFLTDNHYNFNVLLAVENTMPNQYHVTSIPRKIVIDRKGTIAFDDVQENEIPLLIETALER